jgi:hypothetical protein
MAQPASVMPQHAITIILFKMSPPLKRIVAQLRERCNAKMNDLASARNLSFYGIMRGGAILILLGLTAIGAYSVGRQGAPVTSSPVAITKLASALTVPTALYQTIPAASATASSAQTSIGTPSQSEKIDATEKPPRPDSKRRVEAVLTAATIAAIIVAASRDQYHAGGRPCACPDDSMRNGRACGGRSAYSRRGGAAPLCYPSDVTAAMIESYKQKSASR